MRRLFFISCLLVNIGIIADAQTFMTNVMGRKRTALNGSWQIIIDWFGKGNKMGIEKDSPPSNAYAFNEYAFYKETLKVPSDWNSQTEKLKFYEGTIWYKKDFVAHPNETNRYFVYFGAVNYMADVFLNGQKLGSHEGGFTPFQFEVTGILKNGVNKLVVKVNNQRREDAIPAMSFDWWNYGGITRDVFLIQTPPVFIEDYFIHLNKRSSNEILGWVKINGTEKANHVAVDLPELDIHTIALKDSNGLYEISCAASPAKWTPSNPKLYNVIVRTDSDSVSEKIGFRNIEVAGTEILLNGKPIFLKGISFHEEMSKEKRRATSAEDARQLLTEAKSLGCNFVRLAHYPQNEYILTLADQMGLMVWEEIPLWQGIQFNNAIIRGKAENMLKEMVWRDKNRCGVIIWSLSNETNISTERNNVLSEMASLCRKLDDTRLISSAFHQFKSEGNKIIIHDSLSNVLDVLAVNKYMGWYAPWPAGTGNIVWQSSFNKPLIFSEFGGEAKYGVHGSSDIANNWTEEFQEKLYNDNIEMFKKIPFLRGTCPWILIDFRTPFRMQAVFQDGWNRKGLLSDKWKKKKAWYVMKRYYDSLEEKTIQE